MTDLKRLKNITLALMVGGFLALSAEVARSTIIEGFTPSGQFVSVAVSNNGELRVAGSTSIAAAVFFVSSQPVNAFQAGPWSINVLPSSSTALTGNCVGLLGGVATSIVGSDATRKGSLVCNQDMTLNAWVNGSSGVSDLNTPTLAPGACFTPDDGTIYLGPLFGYSTGAMTLCYYVKN